jgi:thioredoxin 1
MYLNLTDETINEALNNSGITILCFKSNWCGPCKVYTPILKEFSNETPSVTLGVMDIDTNPRTSLKYGIRRIPTTVIFQNGQLITKVPGVIPKKKLKEFVDNLR